MLKFILSSCLEEFKRVLLPFPENTARSIADRFSETKAHFIHPKFSSIVEKNLNKVDYEAMKTWVLGKQFKNWRINKFTIFFIKFSGISS